MTSFFLLLFRNQDWKRFYSSHYFESCYIWKHESVSALFFKPSSCDIRAAFRGFSRSYAGLDAHNPAQDRAVIGCKENHVDVFMEDYSKGPGCLVRWYIVQRTHLVYNSAIEEIKTVFGNLIICSFAIMTMRLNSVMGLSIAQETFSDQYMRNSKTGELVCEIFEMCPDRSWQISGRIYDEIKN